MQHGTRTKLLQQGSCSARARAPSCSIPPRQQIAQAAGKAPSQRAGACGAIIWLPAAAGAACAAAVAVQLVSCSRGALWWPWRHLLTLAHKQQTATHHGLHVHMSKVAAGGAWAASTSFPASSEDNNQLDNVPSQLSSTGRGSTWLEQHLHASFAASITAAAAAFPIVRQVGDAAATGPLDASCVAPSRTCRCSAWM
jgi:hypothetical protein